MKYLVWEYPGICPGCLQQYKIIMAMNHGADKTLVRWYLLYQSRCASGAVNSINF